MGVVVLALLLVGSLGSVALSETGGTGGASVQPPAAAIGTSPAGVLDVVSSQLGAENSLYRVVADGGTVAAANPAQRFLVRFSVAGMFARTGGATLALRLAAYGYPGALRTVARTRPSVRGNRVVYDYGPVTEEFANGPAGVEQTFTVASRPKATRSGWLTVALAVSGTTRPLLRDGSLTFAGRGGIEFRYRDLVVTDASGRVLPARLAVRGGRILVQVADQDARYPLRIDPLIQQGAKLTPTDATAAPNEFGTSVAVSADGNTALIGGYADGNYSGAAWVFTRAGSTWTQEGPKLTPDDASGPSDFGVSVAISADGDTALIGGINDDDFVGAVWVFTRSGSTWTQEGPKLTPTDPTTSTQFGASVALSADGDTALVGDPGDNSLAGGAWIYTRTGSTWTQQGGELTGPPGAAGIPEFGGSVALSSDGNTALIGAANDSGGEGAAWVFTRTDSTWSVQGPVLSVADQESSSVGSFGTAVALSSDGSTALLGANGGNGGAWVFTRTGTTWTQQGSEITPTDGTNGAGFGWSVALSSDGDTALIGAANDSQFAGAAWLFTRSGDTWTQQGPKVTGSGEAPGRTTFGMSVALSADATTALVGGPNDADGAGAVWAYVTPPAISVAAQLDLGSQTVDTTGSIVWLPVQDTGGAALTFSGPAQISGADANDFTIPDGDDECDGMTISHDTTCQIGIQFTPSTSSDESATLTLGTNNQQAGGQPTLALSGTGIPPAITTPVTPIPVSPVPPVTTSPAPVASIPDGPPSTTTTATNAPQPSSPKSGNPANRCTLSETRKQITVRCTLTHPYKDGDDALRITVKHGAKTIASGTATIDRTTLAATLHTRRRLTSTGSTTVTLTTAGKSTTIHATIN